MVLYLLALPLVDHEGFRSYNQFPVDHSPSKNILCIPGDKGRELH